MLTQYARTSSSSTRAVAGNQFVIGDSEDEDEDEEEGEVMGHVDIVTMSSCHVNMYHQIMTRLATRAQMASGGDLRPWARLGAR